MFQHKKLANVEPKYLCQRTALWLGKHSGRNPLRDCLLLTPFYPPSGRIIVNGLEMLSREVSTFYLQNNVWRNWGNCKQSLVVYDIPRLEPWACRIRVVLTSERYGHRWENNATTNLTDSLQEVSKAWLELSLVTIAWVICKHIDEVRLSLKTQDN
jgi:hypothetical protein